MARGKKTKAADESTVSIKTVKLQEMVGKAIKGAGNNKVIPITQMMCVKLEEGVLTLITTDATNTLYIRENGVIGTDFYAVVPVDQFSRLISRITSEDINLRINGTALEVNGNGKYQIPLQYDENDMVVAYPDPLSGFDMENSDDEQIESSVVSKILSCIKPALATTLENPFYTGYYVGDSVVATDRFLINRLDVALLDEPRLISSQVMDLLSVMTQDTINVNMKDDIMVFATPDCVVYGHDLEGIEEYSIEDIQAFIELDFQTHCQLPKNELLQLLDRLSLFVTDYDKGGIFLTFTEQGLQVTSKASTGVEVVPYKEITDFEEFTCCMDLTCFIKELKAYSGDVVNIYYDTSNAAAIELQDGDVLQVIGLLQEDEQE